MVLKSKFLAFKRNFYSNKYRKYNALAKIYEDYSEFLKEKTTQTVDSKVSKFKEKCYTDYQKAYYDLGSETDIFNTVYTYKYEELKKSNRMKFRKIREATRRKIKKLDPVNNAEEIQKLLDFISQEEIRLRNEVDEIASTWKADFESQRANGLAKNPSEETLFSIREEIEKQIETYREELSTVLNAKLEKNVAKNTAKTERFRAKAPIIKEKLDKSIDEYISYLNKEDSNKTNSEIAKLSSEIEKYKNKIASETDEAKIEKLNKIVSTLENELSSKKNEQISTETEIKDDEILSVNDLCMYFGGIKAVNHLNFTVKHKEIFGLIGPNGAGKTTVFNCITQFYKPTAGKLLFRNKNNEIIDLNREVVHNVILQGIVRTFQNLEVIKDITVLDNLLVAAHRSYTSNLFQHMFHTKILRVEETVIKKRAIEVLKFMGLLKYKDMYAWGLPYGILKKIEIARTLMCSPQLIILDEPAAGLNDSETVELAELIHRIRDEYDSTILLVEHDMGLVMKICDRICAISFGNLLALGTPSEIQSNKAVQEAYLGVSED